MNELIAYMYVVSSSGSESGDPEGGGGLYIRGKLHPSRHSLAHRLSFFSKRQKWEWVIADPGCHAVPCQGYKADGVDRTKGHECVLCVRRFEMEWVDL